MVQLNAAATAQTKPQWGDTLTSERVNQGEMCAGSVCVCVCVEGVGLAYYSEGWSGGEGFQRGGFGI